MKPHPTGARPRQFVGIGFGSIQSGLFLLEASQSGRFGTLTVADVDATLVQAIRNNGGRYTVNVAHVDEVAQHDVSGVTILNPNVPADREKLVCAIAEADEIATALPSVSLFEAGDVSSPVACLAAGLSRREPGAHPAVIYTAENNNHAAEILEAKLTAFLPGSPCMDKVQILNTVIGKMSGVIMDAAEQQRLGLIPLVPDIPRAVLVEEFNRIMISRIRLPGFVRGLANFEEKDDLLPFEEAKLYGHNAVHALLGYLAHAQGMRNISEAGLDAGIMATARSAFLEEAGAGLIHRYRGVDPLFTPEGFQAYAEDLLMRMVNPYLCDAVSRVIRDTERKLGWDDRLIGTMRLALQAGVQPVHFAEGARLAALHWAWEGLRKRWPVSAEKSCEIDPIGSMIFGEGS